MSIDIENPNSEIATLLCIRLSSYFSQLQLHATFLLLSVGFILLSVGFSCVIYLKKIKKIFFSTVYQTSKCIEPFKNCEQLNETRSMQMCHIL